MTDFKKLIADDIERKLIDRGWAKFDYREAATRYAELLEKALEALELSFKYVNCSEQCSTNDSWLKKCSCGSQQNYKYMVKIISEITAELTKKEDVE